MHADTNTWLVVGAAVGGLLTPALRYAVLQAAPEGAGRGAGGTPHDIALARARQAAAADDMAAAAAAPGGSTLPRSRTRFACAAESGGSAHTGEHHAAATVAAPHAGLESVREEVQEEAAQSPQQAQQQHDQQAQQAQQQHEAAPAAGRAPGKPRKAVAFAALQQDADRVPGTAAHQEQQAPPAARQESRRGRRLTRAAAAALSLSEVALLAADLAPAAATATAEQAPALLEQADTAASAAPVASMQPAAAPALGQRGRRRTQAVPAAAAVRASELQAASQTTVAQAELPPLQPSQQAAVSGPDATCGPTGAAAGQGEEEDVPLMASVTFHQLCDRIVGPSSPEKVPPAAAVEAARPRRRGRWVRCLFCKTCFVACNSTPPGSPWLALLRAFQDGQAVSVGFSDMPAQPPFPQQGPAQQGEQQQAIQGGATFKGSPGSRQQGARRCGTRGGWSWKAATQAAARRSHECGDACGPW